MMMMIMMMMMMMVMMMMIMMMVIMMMMMSKSDTHSPTLIYIKHHISKAKTFCVHPNQTQRSLLID